MSDRAFPMPTKRPSPLSTATVLELPVNGARKRVCDNPGAWSQTDRESAYRAASGQPEDRMPETPFSRAFISETRESKKQRLLGAIEHGIQLLDMARSGAVLNPDEIYTTLKELRAERAKLLQG